MKLAAGVVVAALCAQPAAADAHIVLMSPTPRSNAALKTGPCGGIEADGDAAAYEPGAAITVSWLETVDHPGYYRIAFSPGELAPAAGALPDNTSKRSKIVEATMLVAMTPRPVVLAIVERLALLRDQRVLAL